MHYPNNLVEKYIKLDRDFFNYPKFLEREKYDEFLKTFIKIYSREDYVRSILQFGSINNPGISDLDLAVVCSDYPDTKIQDPIKLIHDSEEFDKSLKEYFAPFQNPGGLFDMYFFNESFIHDNSLHNLSNLNVHFSRSDYIDNFNAKVAPSSHPLARLIRVFYTFYFDSYISILTSPRVDVHGALYSTLAIKHPIKLIKEIGGEISDKQEDIVAALKNLREGWFDRSDEDNKKQLITLLFDCLFCTSELMIEIEKCINIRYCSINNNDKVIGKNIRRQGIFVTGLDRFDFHSWFRDLIFCETKPMFRNIWPANFLLFFKQITKQEGHLSDFLSKEIIGLNISELDFEIKSDMEKNINNFIPIFSSEINNHISYCSKNLSNEIISDFIYLYFGFSDQKFSFYKRFRKGVTFMNNRLKWRNRITSDFEKYIK